MLPLKILHPITRLIIGGAQENTMLTTDYLMHEPEFAGTYQVDIVCGPQTGPEGSLIEEVWQRGIPLKILPSLRREISLANDIKAFWQFQRLMQGTEI